MPDAERKTFDRALRAYNAAMRHAIQAGLEDHPHVRAWISAKRSVGDHEELRALRLGLERGIASISVYDAWLAIEVQAIIGPLKGRTEDLSEEEIRHRLIARVISADYTDYMRCARLDVLDVDVEALLRRLKCSRQAFHKWLIQANSPHKL